MLVLGLALLAGGFRHGLLRLNVRLASLNSALMILAWPLSPARAVATLVADRARVEDIVLVAFVLLLSYGAYLVFVLRGTGPFLSRSAIPASCRLRKPKARTCTSPSRHVEPAPRAAHAGRRERWHRIGQRSAGECRRPCHAPVRFNRAPSWVSFSSRSSATRLENWAAVRAAWHDKVDLTLGIPGSSTQIPLFVAPVLIFASLALGQPMTLVFEPLESMCLSPEHGHLRLYLSRR